jgi:hypothetical protein
MAKLSFHVPCFDEVRMNVFSGTTTTRSSTLDVEDVRDITPEHDRLLDAAWGFRAKLVVVDDVLAVQLDLAFLHLTRAVGVSVQNDERMDGLIAVAWTGHAERLPGVDLSVSGHVPRLRTEDRDIRGGGSRCAKGRDKKRGHQRTNETKPVHGSDLGEESPFSI